MACCCRGRGEGVGQQGEETSFFCDFRNLGDSCVECLGKRLVLSREMD